MLLEESSHLERKMAEEMPFKFLFKLSRDWYEGNRKVRFSRKTGYVFQNQEWCHLESIMPEQIPFKILRNII